MKIRLYQSKDRPAVRALALATAEAGEPSRFADQEHQADLLTRYYTEREPESLWIAENNGAVVGYLTGCLDSRRYVEWAQREGRRLTLRRMLTRNLFRPAMWKWFQARRRTLAEGGAHREEWICDYPAHLHINLAKQSRGTGTGRKLMDTFLDQCRQAGVTGVHLATRADNRSAQEFFKKCGFRAIATINAYRPEGNGLIAVPVLIMGIKRGEGTSWSGS